MKNTQYEMIEAAASIAAMMTAKPVKKLMGGRTEKLVHSVFLCAAKAAYLRAAQECLNAAYDDSGGLDLEAAHAMIADPSVNLQNLITMCQPGYAWGGSVVTL